jgi:hypothetical protein
MARIIFLDYLSRSGSTFLASELNKITGVSVTRESRLTFNYKPAELKLRGYTEIEDYHEFLKKYKKNDYWNITINDLKSLRENAGYSDVLDLFINSNYSGDDIVIKKGSGNYILNYGNYVNALGKLPIIAMYRNPLEIYASQKRSIDSETGQAMSKGILKFIFNQRRYVKNLNKLNSRNDILVIEYVRLVSDLEGELKRIAAWLGVEYKTEDKKYFSDIPGEQKHLHKNIINQSYGYRSKNKWKEELNILEIVLIKTFCIRFRGEQ